VTLNTIATYGQTRFRAGAEPSLAVLAAVGIAAFVSWLQARRRVQNEPVPVVVTAPE
jgi:hypothetical protein